MANSSFRDSLQQYFRPFRVAYGNKRVGFMFPFGFASGLPLTLTGGVLVAWMADSDVDLTTIGFFALVGLPYNLKFLWAPLLDRFRLPWLSRRRDWMLVFQLGLMAAIWTLGSLNPGKSPGLVALMALVVVFFSASQDVVIDAYRTDALREKQRASGVAVFVALYRLALIVVGGGGLILADYVPWERVYQIFALLMLVGVIATVFAPQARETESPPRNLRSAVFEPLKDLFGRKNAFLLLLFVLTYKIGDYVVSHILMAFLIRDMGFSKSEIGIIVKFLGVGATILGSFVGGGLVAKIGLRSALLFFGILQAAANVMYATLALVGQSHVLLVLAIGVDNLFNGMGMVAFVALLMTLCDARFSATQYALLSSAGTIFGRLLSSGSGYIAEKIGWPGFWLLTVVAAIPALIILFTMPKDILENRESA